MKAACPTGKTNKTASLNERIRHSERQLLNRRRQVDTATVKLFDTIHRQITKPASLLLASGTGFIIGELTKSQAPQVPDVADRANAIGTATPVMTLLNLMTSVHTLRTALPLAWMLKSFFQPAPSHPTHGSSNG